MRKRVNAALSTNTTTQIGFILFGTAEHNIIMTATTILIRKKKKRMTEEKNIRI